MDRKYLSSEEPCSPRADVQVCHVGWLPTNYPECLQRRKWPFPLKPSELPDGVAVKSWVGYLALHEQWKNVFMPLAVKIMK